MPSRPRRPSTINQRIVMLTGVAGVIVVAISTCFTAYQAMVMRREFNNTLDQQRAWVKVDAEPQAYIATDDHSELIIHVKATNVGSVPALGVNVGTALWPGPGPHDMTKKPLHPFNKNCPSSSGVGTTIFPGEAVELFHSEPRAPAGDVRYLADDQNHVQVMAVLCVTYRSGSRQELRHTAASFAILKQTVKYGVENDDSKLDATHEALIPPVLHLLRFGVWDEAD